MPEQTRQAAWEAVERAEKAAGRAEKAAERARYILAAGLLFALVGAVLVFALEESDPSVLGVSLQPLGGVLFAAGVLLIACGAIGSIGKGDGGTTDSNSVKAVGGLIAVVTGITAVAALTVVTLTQLGTGDKDSMVAVTSSAFGIISAVVGAYLGIKITADTNEKASDEAKKQAEAAQHQFDVVQHQISAMEKKAEEVAGTKAEAIKAAGYQAAGEEAARMKGSHRGGESA